MTYRIIAISPFEGKAFVVEGEKTLFLAPPYKTQDLQETSLIEVEKAVAFYEYEPCEVTFERLSEVIRYLKNKCVKSFENKGIEVPTSDKLRELLRYADDDILQEYLKKSMEILVPEGKIEAAKNIAIDIIKIVGSKNQNIMTDAIEVLNKCENSTNIESIISEETLRKRFPHATEKYTPHSIARKVEIVSQRRSLLPPIRT